MNGFVQTVLGPVDPKCLGRVLTHEHLFHELSRTVFKTAPPQYLPLSQFQTLNLENLGTIRQYPYSCDENLEFGDDAVKNAVHEEMKYLKTVGGKTVVENSSIGLRAKTQATFLKKLSEDTGMQIVAGTGFYVACAQNSQTLNLSSEEIEDTMRKDIIQGIDGTDIKCGVIGEIGCSWPLVSFEKRVLESAASIQDALCCPVIIHPGRNKHSPYEIMRIFLEAGGKSSKTVMSHLDRTILHKEELADFSSTVKCICEFDLFGLEVSHYQLVEEIDMPSDAQRIKRIQYLVEQGYGDRIVISHDIHTKHRLKRFGGHGYSHILENAVPKMIKKGIAMEDVDKILVHNPRKWLTFGEL